MWRMFFSFYSHIQHISCEHQTIRVFLNLLFIYFLSSTSFLEKKKTAVTAVLGNLISFWYFEIYLLKWKFLLEFIINSEAIMNTTEIVHQYRWYWNFWFTVVFFFLQICFKLMFFPIQWDGYMKRESEKKKIVTKILANKLTNLVSIENWYMWCTL